VAKADRFEEFVTMRSPRLLRTCFLLTREHAAAEDLLQTALAKAWLAWSRLDDEPEAYVRRIIVNEFTSAWRRKWRGEVPTELRPDGAHRGGAVQRDATGQVDDRHQLWDALGRLPRRQRAVVVLRFYEDLSEEQTAAVLGISVGTVKSQSSKALATMRFDPALLGEPKDPPARRRIPGAVRLRSGSTEEVGGE
jgi:RNA polymerase sigma-70 factor (sigma-E family)